MEELLSKTLERVLPMLLPLERLLPELLLLERVLSEAIERLPLEPLERLREG